MSATEDSKLFRCYDCGKVEEQQNGYYIGIDDDGWSCFNVWECYDCTLKNRPQLIMEYIDEDDL